MSKLSLGFSPLAELLEPNGRWAAELDDEDTPNAVR